MKKIFLLICCLPTLLQAQSRLTMRECIDLLTKNNLVYKEGNLQAESAEAQLRQTRSQILPQISIGSNNSINLGRSIDQYTNEYIDQVYNYSSIGAGFQMPVFQGGKFQNQVRQSVLLKESAVENRTAVFNRQVVLLMQGYVNVLATKAIYEAAGQQVESSQIQVDRVEKQVSAGVVGNNILFEIKAQLANDKYAQVTALNNYRTARLALFQRINIPPSDSLDLEPLTPVEVVNSQLTAAALYDHAQLTFPEAKSADLYRKSFGYQVKAIRADNFPSLTLGGDFGAFFASTNKKLDYFGQMNATRNGSMYVRLNIPIMGRWVTRPRVEFAKVQERLAQNQEETTKQILRQGIEQAVLDMTATTDKFSAAQGQAESLAANFTVVESKLNAGTANVFEYSLAKANLAKAEANAIQARYEYLMQQRLMQYYQQGNWDGVF
jgi:outer membrane protein